MAGGSPLGGRRLLVEKPWTPACLAHYLFVPFAPPPSSYEVNTFSSPAFHYHDALSKGMGLGDHSGLGPPIAMNPPRPP